MNARPRWPLVEVEWLDAHACGGWETPATYRADAPAVCCSVGYLLHRTRAALTLVQSCGLTTGEVTDALTIPRGCVRKMRRLR
jgi:hypothetical protein